MPRDIKQYYGVGAVAVEALMHKLAVAKNVPSVTPADLVIDGSNVGGELAPPPAGMRYTAYIHNNRPVAKLVDMSVGAEQRQTSRATAVDGIDSQTEWATQAQRDTAMPGVWAHRYEATMYYITATKGSTSLTLGTNVGGWNSADVDALIATIQQHVLDDNIGWTITKHAQFAGILGNGNKTNRLFAVIGLSNNPNDLFGELTTPLDTLDTVGMSYAAAETALASLPSALGGGWTSSTKLIVPIGGGDNSFKYTPGATTQTEYALTTSRNTTGITAQRQTYFATDVAGAGQHQTAQSTMRETTVQTAPDGSPTLQTATLTDVFTQAATQYSTSHNVLTMHQTELEGIGTRNTAVSTALLTEADTGVSSATIVSTDRVTLQERIDSQQTYYNYSGNTSRETTAENNTTKTRNTQNAAQTHHVTDISGFQPELERSAAETLANGGNAWAAMGEPQRTYNSAMSVAAALTVDSDQALWTGGYRAVAHNFSAQTVFYGEHATDYEASTGLAATTDFATIKATHRDTGIVGYYNGNTSVSTARLTLSNVSQTQRLTSHDTVASTVVDGVRIVNTQYETSSDRATERSTSSATEASTSWDTVTEGSLQNTQAGTVFDTQWYTSGDANNTAPATTTTHQTTRTTNVDGTPQQTAFATETVTAPVTTPATTTEHQTTRTTMVDGTPQQTTYTTSDTTATPTGTAPGGTKQTTRTTMVDGSPQQTTYATETSA